MEPLSRLKAAVSNKFVAASACTTPRDGTVETEGKIGGVQELLAETGLIASSQGVVPSGPRCKLSRGGPRSYSFKKRCPSHRDEHFPSMCFIKGVECGCYYGVLHRIVAHLDRRTERRKDKRLKGERATNFRTLRKKRTPTDNVSSFCLWPAQGW